MKGNFQISKPKYDAVVIGAGVAGLGVALELSEIKLRVLVISKSNLAGEASVAAAGMLDPFLEIDRRDHPLLNLTIPAFQNFPQGVQQIQSETRVCVRYKKTGLIYRAFTGQETRELKRRYQWQRLTPVRVQLTGSDLIYPDVGRVYPGLYIRGLKKLAGKKGVAFRSICGSVKLKIRRGRFEGVFADGQLLEVPLIVNAAGSWAKSVTHFPYRGTISPVRGQIMLIRSREPITKSILHGMDNAYIVPWENQRYLCGSTAEMAGFRPRPTTAGISKVWSGIEKLAKKTSGLCIERIWAGLRPKTADGLPVIGRTRISGVYIAGGFYRSGILFGWYAGKLLANFIGSGRIPHALIPFNPLRSESTRKEKLS